MDEMEAEIAITLVQSEDDLKKSVRNEKNDPPILYLESIEELEDFNDVKIPGSGYSFYAEDQ